MIRCYDDLLKFRGKLIYLYGAKKVAMEIKDFFKSEGVPFEGYIVTVPAHNSTEIEGKPVKTIDSLKDELSKITIIVACIPNFKKSIVETLLAAGARNIECLENDFALTLQQQEPAKKEFNLTYTDYFLTTPKNVERHEAIIRQKNAESSFRLRTELGWMWNITHMPDKDLFKSDNLKKEFEALWCKFIDVKDLPPAKKNVDIQNTFNIFSIRSHVDRNLYTKEKNDYITEIQAGAQIAPTQICECTDNTGVNISDRNKDFSECTAIYWAGKNASDKEYTGVMHYRRHLDLTKKDLANIKENDIDLVNTIPCIWYPNIKTFFTGVFLYSKDWSLMNEAVETLHPEYLKSVMHVAQEHYYLANNIMIMKSCWFKKMCDFVFDVLLYIDDYYRKINFTRQDRYAGYIFEFLYSVFVYHHSREMKIAFADMTFLI